MNAFLKLLSRREAWALLGFMLGVSLGDHVSTYTVLTLHTAAVWLVFMGFLVGLGVFLGVLFSVGIKARTGFFTCDE